MKYYYKNNEILSKKDWKNAFCASYSKKEDNIHWKTGRSGERLAEDFMGDKAKGEFTMIEMVRTLLDTKNVYLEKACIEYDSQFDNYSKPRKQDLAIWGKANGKSIFIGVEAKVDERFGTKSLKQQRDYVDNLKDQKISTNADKRLNELISDFLNGEERKNENLRYQLLYYLAGSIREMNCDVVFMPVLVYKTDSQYSEAKGNRNRDDYTIFMNALKFSRITAFEKNGISLAYHRKFIVNGIKKDVYSCYIEK